jgi:hypothetical protein
VEAVAVLATTIKTPSNQGAEVGAVALLWLLSYFLRLHFRPKLNALSAKEAKAVLLLKRKSKKVKMEKKVESVTSENCSTPKAVREVKRELKRLGVPSE